LAKIGHPKFEGHVTPTGDEYQKSVRLKFRLLAGFHLGVSEFTISLLITCCLPAEEIKQPLYCHKFWISAGASILRGSPSPQYFAKGAMHQSGPSSN